MRICKLLEAVAVVVSLCVTTFAQGDCADILTGKSKGKAPESAAPAATDIGTRPKPSPHLLNAFRKKEQKTRAELSKPEMRSRVSKAVCIKSYPWPEPWHGEDFQKMSSSDLKTITETSEPRIVAREIMGYDRKQIELYGSVLYVVKLFRDRNWVAVKKEADEALKASAIAIGFEPWDNVQDATYFSAKTLANMLYIFRIAAQAEILRDKKASVAERIDLVGQFLTVRDLLEPTLENSPFGDLTEQILGILDDSVPVEASGLKAGLADSKRVLGVVEDSAGTTVYFAGKRLVALRMNYDTESWELVDDVDAAMTFHASYVADLVSKSSKDMVLWNVMKFGDNWVITTPTSQIELGGEEARYLAAGKALPEVHALTKELTGAGQRAVVSLSNAFMQRAVPTQVMRDADSLFFLLRRAYPSSAIMRDPWSERTSSNVASIIGLKADAKQLVALVPARSAGILDANVIQNLRKPLKEAGIEVLDFDPASANAWAGGDGKVMIVISGHIDTKLREAIRTLGQQGYFKNNYVILSCCEFEKAADAKQELTARELIREISGHFGAIGTFAFESEITPEALDVFIGGFADHVKEWTGSPFLDVMRKLLEAAKLNGIWTVCDAIHFATDKEYSYAA